ncbi:plasminogen-like [Bolinopsis microptera]|uniref:plasminogen-like n=1 Tax=Bolinopsis microptera TaxID=2820187 RepID=UPI0030790632
MNIAIAIIVAMVARAQSLDCYHGCRDVSLESGATNTCDSDSVDQCSEGEVCSALEVTFYEGARFGYMKSYKCMNRADVWADLDTCRESKSEFAHILNDMTEYKCSYQTCDYDLCISLQSPEEPWWITKPPITEINDCVDRADNDGSEYRGKVAVTESGHKCQKWDSQSPNIHGVTPSKYPNSGLQENYCRNPDGEPGAWCYNAEGTSPRFELCAIPTCPEPDCVDSADNDGSEYRGKVAVTKSGHKCQKWDSQSPNIHGVTPSKYPNSGLQENYCRNPDGEPFAWCYNADGTSPRWEVCDIPTCGN